MLNLNLGVVTYMIFFNEFDVLENICVAYRPHQMFASELFVLDVTVIQITSFFR